MSCVNCKNVHSCKRQCMDLPKGKTCGDCALFETCEIFLGSTYKRRVQNVALNR